MLPQLVRERHFGIATGLVAEKAADKAEQLILEARDRVLSEQPGSWGEALGDLNDQLCMCLRDRQSTGWFVGEAPLGLWNSAALIEARD